MPCPYGLALSRVPAAMWTTRVDLLQRLDVVHQMLMSGLGDGMNVDTLAALAMLSKHHFIRLFTKTYGQTPIRFAREHRLRRAAVLITSGEAVGQAAVAVGYESLPSFSREFVRQFGFSPSRLRNRG